MINVWLGYDVQFTENIPKLIESICNNTKSVKINFLIKDKIKELTRPQDENQSTDSAFTRWMVPYLAEYRGWHLYIDSDTIVCDDLTKLWDLRDESKSVMVVKHKIRHNEGIKFNRHKQLDYTRKNWSSVMLINAKKCKMLSPLYVNSASGLDLHQFKWLEDNSIGELPSCWNHLVGIDEKIKHPGIVHWTLGGPWNQEFKEVDYADLWNQHN